MGYFRIQNLGKAYKRYSHKWGRLAEWLGARSHHELIWALKDVSFSVESGEAVGIIGVNGAGKSTLLKMITGTTKPTTGSVESNGRISAMLELGMGFHPDFTGRQNVYMAAHIGGLKHQEIADKMREIEDFAEIGDYIDQPVRVYSSGMQVRLAFSVATAVRPDILIIDEALSVGDRYFSQKSLSRILDFRQKGTSLLFVSHDASAVKMLCDRALLLHKGVMLKIGSADSVIDFYNGLILADLNKHHTVIGQSSEKDDQASPLDHSASKQRSWPEGFAKTHPQIDTNAVSVEGFGMYDICGNQIVGIRSGDEVSFEYVVKAKLDLDEPHFGISIRNSYGVSLFNTNSFAMGRKNDPLRKGQSVKVLFRMRLPLASGYYGICIGVANNASGDSQFDEYIINIINADVLEVLPKSGQIRFGGYFNLSPAFALELKT